MSDRSRSRSKSRRRSSRRDEDEEEREREETERREEGQEEGQEESPEGEPEPQEEEEVLTPQQVEERKKRMKNADRFKKYLNKNGLPLAFQVIFAEILAKGIKEENVFSYTAMRLRQIGNDIIQIVLNYKFDEILFKKHKTKEKMNNSTSRFNLKNRIQAFFDTFNGTPKPSKGLNDCYLEEKNQVKIQKLADTTAKKKASKRICEEDTSSGEPFKNKNYDKSSGRKLNFEHVLGSKDIENTKADAQPTLIKLISSQKTLLEDSPNLPLQAQTTPNHTRIRSEAITATAKKDKDLIQRNFKEDEIQKSKENFTTPLPKRDYLLRVSSTKNKICLKKKLIRPKRRKRKVIKLKNSHQKSFCYDLIDDTKLNLPLRVQLKVIKSKNDDDFDTDEDQCQRSSYYCLREVEEAHSKILKRKKLI